MTRDKIQNLCLNDDKIMGELNSRFLIVERELVN